MSEARATPLIAETVCLSDGAQLTIRPVQPDDKPLLADAFTQLSDEARYRRFFTPLRELGTLLERLGDAACEDDGDVLRFDIALPDTGGAGPTLRGLLGAVAAGLLAPTGEFLRRTFPEHEQ